MCENNIFVKEIWELPAIAYSQRGSLNSWLTSDETNMLNPVLGRRWMPVLTVFSQDNAQNKLQHKNNVVVDAIVKNFGSAI